MKTSHRNWKQWLAILLVLGTTAQVHAYDLDCLNEEPPYPPKCPPDEPIGEEGEETTGEDSGGDDEVHGGSGNQHRELVDLKMEWQSGLNAMGNGMVSGVGGKGGLQAAGSGQVTGVGGSSGLHAAGNGQISVVNGSGGLHAAGSGQFISAPEIALEFRRIFNSRTVNFNDAYWEFGNKQTWQHNWNWETRQLASTTFGIKDIKVRYPSGEERNFVATSTNATQWVPVAHVGDRLYAATGGHLVLVQPDGREYYFKKLTLPKFRLEKVRNGQGTSQVGLIYDSANRLIQITNNFGRWITIQRQTNAGGSVQISKLQSSDGREVTYGYSSWPDNGNEVLNTVNYPGGEQAQYGYAGAQSLSTGRPLLANADDPKFGGRSARTQYSYNYNFTFDFGQGPYLVSGVLKEKRNLSTSQLIVSLPLGSGHYPQILEGNGAEITRKYTNGLPWLSADGEGRTTTATRDNGGYGHLTSLTGPNGGTTFYQRDYAGRILAETNPMGGVYHCTYNPAGFLLTETDELGRTITTTRDSQQRPIKITYPDNSFEEWTYNNQGQVLTHRLRNGGIEQFDYYGFNQPGGWPGDLHVYTDPMGNTTTYTYDNAGRVTSITDALNRITTYNYNWRGKITKRQNPDNTTVSYGYDFYGNLLAITNEMGQSVHFAYDEYNRVETLTDAIGRKVQYEYGLTPGCGSCSYKNNLTQITYPSGKRVQFAYDKSGLRTSRTTAAGTPQAATTYYHYDNGGRLKQIIGPMGQLSQQTHDLLDQPLSYTDPLGRVTHYDYDTTGNLLSLKRPDGTTTTYTYDNMNRVTLITDALGQTTELGYDDTDQVSKLTDAKGNTYNHTYNLNGRLTGLFYPDNTEEKYHYDPVGNLIHYTNRAGQNLTLTYNLRNRHIYSDWNDPLTSDIAKTYDLVGRLTTLSNQASFITYNYNSVGQLIDQIQTLTGAPGPKTITYAYHDDGMRGWIQYPAGTQLKYYYTPKNQLQEISLNGDSLVLYNYDDNGRRLSKQLANSTETSYDYDSANQLIQLTHNINGTKQAFTYAYNLVGNRTSIQRNNGTIDQYSYDAIDQLLNVDSFQSPIGLPNKVIHYDYDQVGNREQVTENAITTTYKPNLLNQYETINGAWLKYDNNGNLTKYQSIEYTYDAQNRLLSVNSNNNPIATFTYDARNRCIKRVINGTTNYLYYDNWNLIEEYDASNNLLTSYIHGNRMDEILSRITPITQIYYHHDALGNVTHLSDVNGHIIEKYVYDPFGKPTILNTTNGILQTSAYGNRFLFTGREYLKEIGLYDYRNRIYSPELGRFLQTDPIEFRAGDANIYRYCGNNPVNWIDPLGLFQFGSRPLDDLGGFYLSNDLLGEFNLDLSHEQGFFEDGSGEDVGFFPDGVHEDSTDKWYRMDERHYDDDLMRKAIENVDPGDYHWIKNNCQDYADKLREEYERLKKEQEKKKKKDKKEPCKK